MTSRSAAQRRSDGTPFSSKPMKILLALLAALTGGGQAPQSAMNARMRDAVGSPFLAGLVSYVVSAVVLVAFAASGLLGRPRVAGILRAPWWVWFAGFIGAAQVTVNAIDPGPVAAVRASAAPRTGAPSGE